MMREIIRCRGHENVRATHKSTLEFTKENYLTPRGDCILCIEADRGINDLSEDFKRALRAGKKLLIRIRVGDLTDEVLAEGSPELILEHEYSMVIRKSTYVDSRTLAIRANKAARDIDRRIVELLKNPGTIAEIELVVLD
ncbi:DUF371 domain-containing protein [Thermococcus sp. 18S1]|uniref:DUF371 domain-containing protein n=1 Tax=Thermococcus sp. 18S1 TaxID=1638210 RepID=UPI00143941B0|nr:DUF371 domain-containing protein [Thermococcus sp. 18S1]NJE29679.1 DUF371 domain-containing protein [Thermococcus sp. 18S1]